MNRKYESICRKEGVSEQKTREIRRIFNTDVQRANREKRYREEHGISICSLSALGAGDEEADPGTGGEFEIADLSGDPLEKLIRAGDEEEHEKQLAVLQEIMAELDPEDAYILRKYYSGGYGIESALARELGMERKAFIRRRRRLLEMVRVRFFEKYDVGGCPYNL